MGSDEGYVPDSLRRERARLAEGNTFAASLVGLDRDRAVSQTKEHGFDPELVLPTTVFLTLDCRPDRVRLFLDETNTVVRAEAG